MPVDDATADELKRWEPFLHGDERRKELLRDNLALVHRLKAQMEYAELVERDETGKILKDVNPGGFARLAEVILKAVPLQAMILGLDLKRTTSGEQLADANDIAEYAALAKEKIASALSQLQRSDAAEYEKTRKRLQETEGSE